MRSMSSPRRSLEYGHYEEAPRILIVDDETVILEILTDFLSMEGYQVRAVENGKEALEELSLRPYNLVITDLKMPDCSGIELLEKINELRLDVITVIMTGFGTVETAIEAMKKGAYDYILKPFKVEEVVHVVQRGLEKQRLMHENIQLKESINLYRVSEAINSSLSFSEKAAIILETTAAELNADVVTMHLETDGEGRLVEVQRRLSPSLRPGDSIGELNIPEILQQFMDNRPVLYHGLKASRFFVSPPSHRISSFISIPLWIQDRVIGLLSAYTFARGYKFNEGQRKMLSVVASRAAVSIENARLYENLKRTFTQTIQGLARALEASDPYTRGHSDRVAVYSRLIATGLDLPEREVEIITNAALLHDLGKIGIRNEKLNKPGKLTAEEYQMFKMHPVLGRDILEPIRFLVELVPCVYHHHEQWDGSGYPDGIRGPDIPIGARLISVADAYDAMTSDRAYRRALPHDIALAELRRCAGSQFDAVLVGVFVIEITKHRRACLEQSLPVPP
jgi:response regulator RpfG family c-di-GMP phosphodiesterase